MDKIAIIYYLKQKQPLIVGLSTIVVVMWVLKSTYELIAEMNAPQPTTFDSLLLFLTIFAVSVFFSLYSYR